MISPLIVDMRLAGANVISNVSNGTVIVQLMNELIMIRCKTKLGDFEIVGKTDGIAINNGH